MHRLLIAILGVLALSVLTIFLIVLLPDRVLTTNELTPVPESISEPSITFIDPVRGNEDASITIVEYGDYTCALCQTLEPDLQTLIAEAPGKRRLIWKDAPNVGLHPEAFTASMAARCAQDQGAFWAYHDRLMSDRSIPNAERLSAIAQEVGLDATIFENCMAAEVTRPVVQHTLDEAFALGIESTPLFFLNGVRYSGPLTLDGFRNAIMEL